MRFHLKSFITNTSNKYGITLSYTSLATEYVPLWAQTFNVIAKDTSTKTSIQNGQENNTEVTDRNMQGGRPQTLPTYEPLAVETVK